MKIKPLDDRVLVETAPQEEKTASGIIIPDTAKEKKHLGTVIEVGTDEELKELVKPGDKVLYGKYAGEEIKLDDKEYILLQRSDILAIIED
ncbi:co-chaperone GroES [Fidelibacter multiformis]|jgi:chaperonin GroES|uniref:co-chaperone GroES n=1 Tax=Fidelibacter multiformis TaxID=3377529 RepID=UPI0029DBEBC3|nr:co-chaperone GroES [Candidatus Neomarinimicrobiota bacterium]